MNRPGSGYRRSAAVLSVGIGVSGALSYAYFALASHQLDPYEYGSLVVLWSALFMAVVTLYRPVEQLISRTIAEREVEGADSTAELRAAGLIQAGLAAAFVAAALALRGPIEDDLLSGEGTLYAIFLIAGPAYAVSFFARGYLAGRGRFGLYGAMLLLEAGSRFSAAAAVAIGIAEGLSAVAIGIVIAPLLSLIVVPALIRSPGRARAATAADEPAVPTSDVDLFRSGRFVLAAFLILLSEQALLNAGVIVVGASEGAAVAGIVFNVLLLARAPQVLFGAVTTTLLPTLSRLRARAHLEAPTAFDESVRATLLGVAAFTALVAIVVLAAGPQLMDVAFGGGYDYDRIGLLVVTAGMGMHLTALTLSQAALARRDSAAAAAGWVACAIAFVGWSLVPSIEEVIRIEVGYAGATTLLAAFLLVRYRLGHDEDDSPAAARLARS